MKRLSWSRGWTKARNSLKFSSKEKDLATPSMAEENGPLAETSTKLTSQPEESMHWQRFSEESPRTLSLLSLRTNTCIWESLSKNTLKTITFQSTTKTLVNVEEVVKEEAVKEEKDSVALDAKWNSLKESSEKTKQLNMKSSLLKTKISDLENSFKSFLKSMDLQNKQICSSSEWTNAEETGNKENWRNFPNFLINQKNLSKN